MKNLFHTFLGLLGLGFYTGTTLWAKEPQITPPTRGICWVQFTGSESTPIPLQPIIFGGGTALFAELGQGYKARINFTPSANQQSTEVSMNLITESPIMKASAYIMGRVNYLSSPPTGQETRLNEILQLQYIFDNFRSRIDCYYKLFRN